MSKSTKIVAGLLGLAMVVTLGVGVASNANAQTAGYTFTRDLTVGSTGADVTALQATLNAKGYLSVAPTGYFGALTKAAVTAWQASAGLPSTGYFGPMSRAAIAAAVSTGGTSTVPGCTAGAMFSSTTGQPCTSGTTVPGCTAGAMFSSTTGQPCNSGSTTGLTSGAEGSLTGIASIGGNQSTIHEGDDATQVLGLKMKGQDSDVAIERVKVNFTVGTGGSTLLTKYIQSASIYLDGKKLGTVDTSDVSKTDGTYSFNFTGLNGIVKQNQYSNLYVKVTPVDNVDSGNSDVNITVTIPSNGIRAVDGAGISDTYDGVGSNQFSVDTASSGEMTLSANSSDNQDQTVTVSKDNTTSAVNVLHFTVKSKTSDNKINTINVGLATTTSTSTQLSNVIDNVRLFADGKEIDSQSVPTGVGPQTIVFDNLDYDISEGDSTSFDVKVDLAKQGGNYGEGYSFQATTTISDAEDASGNSVTVSGTRTGGNTQLRIQGVSADLVSTDANITSSSVAGTPDRANFTIKFKVTNTGDDDIYVDGDTLFAVTPSSSNDGLQWATTTDSTATTTGSAVATLTPDDGYTSDDVNVSGNKQLFIASGDSRNFTFQVTMNATAQNVSEGVQINGIKWDTVSQDAMSNLYNFNLTGFHTSQVVVSTH